MNSPIFDIAKVKGFLDPQEAEQLAIFAKQGIKLGPCLEVGSYCGKSAIHIATAIQGEGILFAVDHHRGSEENQPGWEWHDPEIWDSDANAMDTLPHIRRNLRQAGVEDTVVLLVGRSSEVSRFWQTPLGFLFIDGGHTMEAAQADLDGWSRWVAPHGFLAIHDVFPDPADGGRPPYEIFKQAVASGEFKEVASEKSLRVLQRVS